ncbi:hypothetical protein BJY04DRAFT_232228 [Aspergillus karnatakaensis]|uniref:flavin-containing monooxygenase n=1 Tax=Aspergillus karnatakaensis TaxID=1810916 RepID=UPI003CCC8FBD
MKGKDSSLPETLDIVIVGAGISGINTAYRVQTKLPDYRYAILEARSDIGGTWDLFKYPGIRSDSDLHTFGFPWSPWTENRAIADGASIAQYMRNNTVKYGIDKHIRLHHRLLTADWSTELQSWDVTVEVGKQQDAPGHIIHLQTTYLVLGTGYYNYREPLDVPIPGLHENFCGKVIHPQFWPETLDYSGKKIVVIGSGATAITLIPNLTPKADRVTMLQRSPTYIMTLPNATAASWIHKIIPASWSFNLTRLWFLLSQVLVYTFCRVCPNKARSVIQSEIQKQLPPDIPIDPHFTPTYKPWDQRLCFTPDGDFFECLRSGKASIVTDTIKSVQADHILLNSGQSLEADIIVTATGLKIGLAIDIDLRVDGEPISIADHYAWRSTMLNGVPNFFFMIGYTNAPWTLGVDVSAKLLVRLLKQARKRNATGIIPLMDDRDLETGKDMPIWNLKATYVRAGGGRMPRCKDSGPCRGRTNYFWNYWKATWGGLEGVKFYRGVKEIS